MLKAAETATRALGPAEEDAIGPLLGVVQSTTGRRWLLRRADERLVEALAQRHDLPDALARLLAARGVSPEEAAAHLDPSLRTWMPP